MTARSHWTSLVVFFACGVLIGMAAIVGEESRRQVEFLQLLRSGSFLSVSQDLQKDMLMRHLEADVVWLELSAAGRVDEASARAEQDAKEVLLRAKYNTSATLSWHHEMLAERFADWQAGAPWVHEQSADGELRFSRVRRSDDPVQTGLNKN
ncbi:MAG: hypothetical protein ACI9EF_003317 [Pseudohongiellaceae bacterium]|jgi:hypothetical protein